MTERKMDFSVADRHERMNDFTHTLAAIIAVTRRDWMLAGQALKPGQAVADAERRELCIS